ncbi:ubiquitin carboxyl-terminal hydrolase L5 [Alternaria panax]|uniref:ubiquitinyl hydrolase 1 n=1 Tax=Alternaria panax TaxID=48097 RepID=A0AAD4NQL9_9PLEO|nr:ubiquitin carboxyl-terminal hydrolase L5 [Alternaria panax]
MSSKDSPNQAAEVAFPIAEKTNDNPTAEPVGRSRSPSKASKTSSSNNSKRCLLEPDTDSEPVDKRPKGSPTPSPAQNSASTALVTPSPPDMPANAFDKEAWQGFCDIESEPACFSVILREMGVRDVTVREVFSMDPDFLLENIPLPIYGFILLFHYREFGNDDQATECPKDVWFANQLPAQNSCATLAMINILMNQSNETEVRIGEHLTQFKDFTLDLSPYQRGEAFASFDFVKKIHNSFAKKMDILEGDKHLGYKVKRTQRIKAQLLSEHSRVTKKGTKSRRAASADTVASNDSAESVEDNAHHYIAFVPVANRVWKLDGLDKQPTCMGSFDAQRGETWLESVSNTISALMSAGDDDYGVIALTQSPLLSLRKSASLTINTLLHVDARLDNVSASSSQDWRNMVNANEQPPSPHMLGLEEHLAASPVSSTVKAAIDSEDMTQLLARRNSLLAEANRLAANIMMEMQKEAEEDSKAAQRRYDSGPVIKKWLEMLAQNGFLEENLDRFMQGKGKK